MVATEKIALVFREQGDAAGWPNVERGFPRAFFAHLPLGGGLDVFELVGDGHLGAVRYLLHVEHDCDLPRFAGGNYAKGGFRQGNGNALRENASLHVTQKLVEVGAALLRLRGWPTVWLGA